MPVRGSIRRARQRASRAAGATTEEAAEEAGWSRQTLPHRDPPAQV
jgi:hypothetical protein